ncbi:MAG: fibronectin type III domain-containing protein [bacterium]|jgi:hypothetical protein
MIFKGVFNNKLLESYLGIFLFCFTFFGCSKEVTIVPVSVPGAPTNIVATPNNTSATIGFSEPSNNGGAAISSYIVTSLPGNITATGVKSPITITGLTNGISYTFTVTAINSAGPSSPSVASNPILPGTGVVTQKNCQITSISNYNANNKTDFSMTVFYDYVNRPSKLVLYDSIRNIILKESVFTYQSDGIFISKYEQLSLDPTTQQVKKYTTKEDLSKPNSDDVIFEYLYNDSGYLVTKNKYINGSKLPTYKTSYSYDANNNLTSCLMVVISTNKKILESTITYDETIKSANFIYPFADGFENYIYTPIFNYGKKQKYPIKNMITRIFDPASGSLIDTWTSGFGTFSMNIDGYITQLTQTGDFQQGLGMFYGKTVLGYVCK